MKMLNGRKDSSRSSRRLSRASISSTQTPKQLELNQKMLAIANEMIMRLQYFFIKKIMKIEADAFEKIITPYNILNQNIEQFKIRLGYNIKRSVFYALLKKYYSQETHQKETPKIYQIELSRGLFKLRREQSGKSTIVSPQKNIKAKKTFTPKPNKQNNGKIHKTPISSNEKGHDKSKSSNSKNQSGIILNSMVTMLYQKLKSYWQHLAQNQSRLLLIYQVLNENLMRKALFGWFIFLSKKKLKAQNNVQIMMKALIKPVFRELMRRSLFKGFSMQDEFRLMNKIQGFLGQSEKKAVNFLSKYDKTQK